MCVKTKGGEMDCDQVNGKNKLLRRLNEGEEERGKEKGQMNGKKSGRHRERERRILLGLERHRSACRRRWIAIARVQAPTTLSWMMVGFCAFSTHSTNGE